MVRLWAGKITIKKTCFQGFQKHFLTLCKSYSRRSAKTGKHTAFRRHL